MAHTKYSEKLADLECRVTQIEERVAILEGKLAEKEDVKPWFMNIRSVSAEEDKIIEAAYEEGRKYRESLRPKPRQKKMKLDATQQESD